jgi:hypothetical protein
MEAGPFTERGPRATTMTRTTLGAALTVISVEARRAVEPTVAGTAIEGSPPVDESPVDEPIGPRAAVERRRAPGALVSARPRSAGTIGPVAAGLPRAGRTIASIAGDRAAGRPARSLRAGVAPAALEPGSLGSSEPVAVAERRAGVAPAVLEPGSVAVS